MPRSIWKGAISFGLVHVPVALYPASQSDDVDFDWLDERTHDPVGYRRINKRTGRAIEKAHVVKGVKTSSGDYVVLDDDEIAGAYPKTLQSIEIQAFVKAAEVAFVYMERPYYLGTSGKGADKPYALLRDAMTKAGVIGIARVVMHTKEHLAALIPAGPSLMLDLLRWSSEVRTAEGIEIPGAAASAKIKDAELKMAMQLIGEMTEPWKPGDYRDTFREAIERLVEQKAKAGRTWHVEPLEHVPEGEGASNVVDLTALLKGSLGRGGGKASARGAARTTMKAAAKAAARQSRASPAPAPASAHAAARESPRPARKTAAHKRA
jgi:DNA end-binding protein Ku